MQHSEFVHLHVHSEYSLLDGAAQLEKLVQRAKDLRFPAIALVVLSGCLNSEVSRLLSQGETQKATEVAGWYQEVFGRDYYFMEVQSHGLEQQARVTADTLAIAKAVGAPIVGTNDSHYLE